MSESKPGIQTIRYAFKGNPERYCSEDADITIVLGPDDNPADVLCAARGIVHTALGRKPTRTDKAAANTYLKRHYGENTSLRDFATGD